MAEKFEAGKTYKAKGGTTNPFVVVHLGKMWGMGEQQCSAGVGEFLFLLSHADAYEEVRPEPKPVSFTNLYLTYMGQEHRSRLAADEAVAVNRRALLVRYDDGHWEIEES